MVKIIQSAIARLTLSYLAIIMALALTFSFLLYQVSSREFDSELRRPESAEVIQPFDSFSFDSFRNERISISRQNLKQGLVLFNIATLFLGVIASYLLARHTLEPIEEAVEAQGRFTADASHELRTPLTAMQTEIEVALRNSKLSVPQAKELLKSNLEELGKLRQLSDGLLRLARNEQPVIKNTPIEPVIDEAIKQVRSLAKTKNIKINKQLSAFKVKADSQSLKDVLVILLDNAIKYSPPNRNVTIAGKRSDGHGEILVQDEGAGIKKADLAHVFERFFRADQSRSKNKVDGHGLGLSIAKQIIEGQKGQISVSSKPGEGSTFTIRLTTR